ncbi:hypothetical protein ACHAXT_012021 [Thalassiosira profunda]
MTPPLPPLSALPAGTYPPSAYPPPSYFESPTLVHPALIFPSQRTGEIQKRLGELVCKRPKRKSVHPPEAGVDYDDEDAEKGYDAKRERKLVLNILGASESGDEHITCTNEGDGSDAQLQTAENDRMWLDPRVQLLLDATASETGEAAAAAPPGRRSVRKSSVRLPNTPYDLLTVDQVLRRILPTADGADGHKESANEQNGEAETQRDASAPIVEEVPSSFEIAGHIAHVNLRSEALPYKYLVGRAILDKNRPRIRVVVNKVGEVEGEFRTFPMEILAGEGLDVEEVERMCAGKTTDGGGAGNGDVASNEVRAMVGPQHQQLMEVEVREHGCRFRLDFARVYFNSRLQGEHERLVREIVRDATERKLERCVVADAMAGVGPFAVPLTSANAPHYRKTKVVCHANDLNPVSYEYLRRNARANKCFADRLIASNLDAREFIHKANRDGVAADHFIMNLPQLAPEFLDAFRGWTFGAADGSDISKRPRVHVHCFDEKARGPEDAARVETQVRRRCERALGCEIEERDEFRARVVRDVGPRKNMLCASFLLPFGVSDVAKLVLPNGKRSRDGNVADDAGIDSTKKQKEM